MALYPCDYNPHHPSRPEYWRTPPMDLKPGERNGFKWSDLAAEIAQDTASEPDPEPEAA